MKWIGSAAPTGRAALALAVIALAALVVPLWLAAAAVLVLLAAAGIDALSVRAAPPIERSVAQVLSRGVDSPLEVRATPRDRRIVVLRQPSTPSLQAVVSTAPNALAGRLVPRERGRHGLPPVASASIGPLGLARVHHPPGSTDEVRVYPDLVAARRLIMRLRRRGLAGQAGRVARGPLGLGTDFESIRDYSADDDIRQLNWRATARLGRPMSNQYRVERDRDVVFLLDTGRLMAAPIGSRTMLDAALDAIVVLALAADELGDRSGAIAFADEVRTAVAPGHLSGRLVIESLFAIEAEPVDSDFELAFLRAGRSRRAFVLVFTDLVDEAAARSLLEGLPMLVRRHAVSVVTAVDPALEELAGSPPTSPERTAAMVVALDMLEARAQAAARLRGLGASVIEGRAEELAERCLDAYLRAKARARA